ncbi:ATP-dependent (S)-NAD(P)H-hydrate dehydratase-like [Zerene cesonia]|uniref:ATP-dependent (S)-NAD(P)H-hydrate dehydratase-like n=1 Tax=Zerene cesonia TaxID=33412 RepID=UPI0018E519AD|nr:ATP-dependent (S)-NAD(P)H-hydrate dehydratase-like [Zerene cesonia]
MLSLRINKTFLNHFNLKKILTAQMNTVEVMKLAQLCIPALDNSKHKGQAGRIGIIGGSLEYTGAPYFAGISALKVGADLVHIFCASQAATVIKSYSPELIVHPLLDDENAVEKISPWFERLHVIVIGPGLGRDSNIFSVTAELIEVIREKQIPLVLDADGLYLITENCNLIQDFHSPIILTPNKIEFERLSNKIDISSKLIHEGSNITILKKGEFDEVLSPVANVQWNSNIGGSGRRCGGQGDILSGSLATFLHWTLNAKENICIGELDKQFIASSIACYAASLLVRKCNEEAFKRKGRSMLATDMIEYIHTVFNEFYEK